MRTFTAGLAAIAVVALVACSPPAAKKDVAASGGPPAGLASINPGQWRTTVTFLDMTAPGLPPGMAEKLKGHPNVSENCVTSEDISDFVGKRSATDEASGTTCTSNHMGTAGGRIDGESNCTDAAGNKHTVRMTGTYASDKVDMTMEMSGDTPKGPMTQKLNMLSERIGACPG